MSRIRIFLLTMATALMLAGCGPDQKTVENVTSAESLDASDSCDGDVTLTLSLPERE